MWGKIAGWGFIVWIVFAAAIAILNSPEAPQKPWECRPQPGYCDIDLDWRPPVKPNEK